MSSRQTGGFYFTLVLIVGTMGLFFYSDAPYLWREVSRRSLLPPPSQPMPSQSGAQGAVAEGGGRTTRLLDCLVRID